MDIYARNIACLLSYAIFCFERLKHAQNFNLGTCLYSKLINDGVSVAW